MKDKFTYIDFLMYVLPGSFLTIVILLGLWSLDPQLLNPLADNLLSSLAFIVMSFVLGNFIQAHSHKGPEERLKKEYWQGYYPSDLMFFYDNDIINESGRQDLLNACLNLNLLNNEDFGLFKSQKPFPKEAVDKAKNIFDYLRVHLEVSDKIGRIRTAEGYYLFYRGLFVSCFWAAIVAIIVTVIFPIRHYFPDNFLPIIGKNPTVFIGFVIPMCEIIICIVLWRSFRDRARGAGQGFAREVYRVFCASSLFGSIKEGAAGETTRKDP